VYAMQYEITLPADYDMKIIRHRVETRGGLTDDFGGLGLKAYLIRERGVDGAPVNQYAPFYLWHTMDGMNRFLWGGGGFGAIVTDFGRPAVRTWTGVTVRPGPAAGQGPRAASREVQPIAPGADPVPAVAAAQRDLERRAEQDGVYATALSVDPLTWTLVQFTLWAGPVPADAPGDRYQVLHLSRPGLAGLRADALAVAAALATG
jgi:hypothetical protein